MRSIGGVSGIGASLSPNRVGGDNFIRYPGDRLILDFHEGAGTTVRDLSGNGNDGTFRAGAAAPTWERNRLGFDGGDFISVADSISLTITDQITVGAQVNLLTTASDYHIMVSKGSKSLELRIQMSTGRLQFITGDKTNFDSSAVDSADAITLGLDYHFTGTFVDADNEVKLSMNGQLKKTLSAAQSMDTSGIDLYIGSRVIGDYGFVVGTVSFIRINATAFSAPQVLQEYLWNKFRN